MRIREARVENLRGYTSCGFSLSRPRTVLVGQNNSGKTSILRMVDWLLNQASESVLTGTTRPDSELIEFLLPARSTRNRARRLTLCIEIDDGRSHKRFSCREGIAELRVNLRQTPNWSVYLALGAPQRGESAKTQDRALELLHRIRADHSFVYVPSFRDGQSPRFQQTLNDALSARLTERALHASQGGAPAEYRKVKKALGEVKKVAEELAAPLWEEMSGHLPPGIAESAKITLSSQPEDLVEWLILQLQLRLSTGAHDKSRVAVEDVGSGLQSLLDLAVQRTGMEEGRPQTLVIEEPESFLHPSAQRTLARSLLADSTVERLIVTTHSSVIVEEAAYSDIVLCRNQGFFEPSETDSTTREEINAALLTGYGAEMIFARSVLLVEGDGDRLFFERLRRRLAAIDNSGRTDELFVVPVGGKSGFAPWIRLLDSYLQRGERPISWLIVADGDAPSQVRQAFSDAGIAVAAPVLQEIGRVGSEMANGTAPWARAITGLNRAARSNGVSFAFAPVDLEHAALTGASDETLSALAEKFGSPQKDLDGILGFLGSKAVAQQQEKKKAPWMRGYIGEALPGNEISDDIRIILQRWLEPAMTAPSAQQLIRELRA